MCCLRRDKAKLWLPDRHIQAPRCCTMAKVGARCRALMQLFGIKQLSTLHLILHPNNGICAAGRKWGVNEECRVWDVAVRLPGTPVTESEINAIKSLCTTLSTSLQHPLPHWLGKLVSRSPNYRPCAPSEQHSSCRLVLAHATRRHTWVLKKISSLVVVLFDTYYLQHFVSSQARKAVMLLVC